jgi:hypothetical protein
MVKINTNYSNLFKLQEKKLSADEAIKIYEDIFSSMKKIIELILMIIIVINLMEKIFFIFL